MYNLSSIPGKLFCALVSGRRATDFEADDRDSHPTILDLSNFGEFTGSIKRVSDDHVEGSFVAKLPDGTPHSYVQSLVGVRVDGGRRASASWSHDDGSYVRMGHPHRNSTRSAYGSGNFNQSGSARISYAKPTDLESPGSLQDSQFFNTSNVNTSSGQQTSSSVPLSAVDFSAVRFKKTSASSNSNNNESHTQRLERRVTLAADDWSPPTEHCDETDDETQHLLTPSHYSSLARRMHAVDQRPSRDSVHSFDSFL